jgi:Phage integrase family
MDWSRSHVSARKGVRLNGSEREIAQRSLNLGNARRRAALPASGRISDRRRRNRGGDHRQRHSGRRHPGTSPQAAEWTPRELRHSFVSLLSSAGIPIKDIAHLVGHANTRTTEKVYCKELRPVLRRGAKAMDDLFNAHRAASEPPLCPPRPARTKQSGEMTLMRLEPDQEKSWVEFRELEPLTSSMPWWPGRRKKRAASVVGMLGRASGTTSIQPGSPSVFPPLRMATVSW